MWGPLLLSPYRPPSWGAGGGLFGCCSSQTQCFDTTMEKAWKCLKGQQDLGMLRKLFNRKAVALKYPQQETAISHRHAKTAVTSLHQGDT